LLLIKSSKPVIVGLRQFSLKSAMAASNYQFSLNHQDSSDANLPIIPAHWLLIWSTWTGYISVEVKPKMHSSHMDTQPMGPHESYNEVKHLKVHTLYPLLLSTVQFLLALNISQWRH